MIPRTLRTTICFAPMLVISVVVSGCGVQDNGSPSVAREISRETPCSLDGMVLADFPGPKGQIVYASGEPDFFCDTVELLAVFLRPEQQRVIRAIYVQDMGQTSWDKPAGHWIDAKTAWYVVGSNKRGSMGPTLATFASQPDAVAFSAKAGGKVMAFAAIKPEMVQLDGGVLKDQRM